MVRILFWVVLPPLFAVEFSPDFLAVGQWENATDKMVDDLPPERSEPPGLLLQTMSSSLALTWVRSSESIDGDLDEVMMEITFDW